ncbi:MAG: hypothetical protein DMF06_08630 [Verrucomicrobia bacterium]|nr:MAG: hypothetical protein DMF06_08630 [Verrucomicrobiota bacterium]
MSDDLFDWSEWRKQQETMNERQRRHATRRRVGRGWLRNSREPETPKSAELLAALDTRQTHDTASLKALGGIFYKIGDDEWCDTSVKSWRKEGADLWVCRS